MESIEKQLIMVSSYLLHRRLNTHSVERKERQNTIGSHNVCVVALHHSPRSINASLRSGSSFLFPPPPVARQVTGSLQTMHVRCVCHISERMMCASVKKDITRHRISCLPNVVLEVTHLLALQDIAGSQKNALLR